MLRTALAVVLTMSFLPHRPSADTIAVAPGSAILDPSRIGASADTTLMTFLRNGEERAGPMQVESTRRVQRDGVAAFEHRIVVLGPDGRAFIDDTTWYHAATLAPIAHQSHASRRTFSLTYAPGRVTGTLVDSTGSHPFEVALPQPVFDPSTMQSIVRALPLAEGKRFAVPLFNHEKRDVEVDTLAVTGSAAVETDRGAVPAWVLTIITADRQATYYVARDDGRELKVVVTWAGGEMRVRHTGTK